MKRFLRRFVAAISCSALVAGILPPQAAFAAAPTRVDPAPLRAEAPVTFAPSPLAADFPLLSIQRPPIIAAPMALPSALSVSLLAVAASDSSRPEKEEVPRAVAPSPERSSRFSWPWVRNGGIAPENLSFDGEMERPPVDESVVETKTVPGRIVAYFRGRLSRRSFDTDAFGGPKFEPMSLRGRFAYGLKGGLYLLGANALLDWIVSPLVSLVHWQLALPAAALAPLGRVELLTQYGPKEIGAALTHAALPFLGIAVPLSTLQEEFIHRFMGFGLIFGVLALAKPVTRMIVGLMERIPDLPQERSVVQPFLLFIGEFVTAIAFPAAAVLTAGQFAMAHFAKWGIDPMVLALNFTAGLILAHLAHRTRGRFTPGFIAPATAHLFFNFAVLGVPLLTLTFGLPLSASVFSTLASIAGVVTLWYSWRARQKDRAAERKNLGLGVKTLLLAAVAASMALNGIQLSGNREFLPAALQTRVVAAAVKPAAAPDPSVPVAAAVEAPAPQATIPPPPIPTPADMIARVKPSVVKVVVRTGSGYSIGSGAIVSPNGLVVTNGHVIGDGKKVGDVVGVRLSNGDRVPALILAVNHNRDLALLKLPPIKGDKPWPTSPFAGKAPREGDVVYAMGHPLGLPFTVTKGILSGVGARGNSFVRYFQHDAAITHGNSGGPLYNEAGEIIGINTLGYEAGGIAFSIITPSIVAAIEQYVATGNMDTAALGIFIDMSSPAQPEKGVAVELVRPGSAAAKGGVLAGDLIIGAGDAELKESGDDAVHELGSILAKAKPGDIVPLTLLRGEEKKTVVVTLDARKTSEATSLAHGFDGEDDEP